MEHKAEIISVGTELLLGNIVNTDAADVAAVLSELGINTYYHTVVGDNPERLQAAVDIAKSRADIIITTGGLGPTCDDLTKQTLAAAFGKELVFHPEEEEKIRAYFDKIGRGMTDNNLRQAELPEGCTILENTCGTAPGCAFEADGCHVVMLPGPPRELRAMLRGAAMPYLRKLSGAQLYSKNIMIFGMGESAVEDKLRELMNSLENPTLAPYAKTGEVRLRVTAKAQSEAEAEAMMSPVIEKVYEAVGEYIYGINVPSLEAAVFALLKERGLTFSCAESCTGGLIAKRMTDVPGASAVFRGGVVSYASEVKADVLGVPAEMLAEHGAVSEPVARAMAEGARRLMKADIAVSTTGVAGPDRDERGNEVGTVYVALAAEGVTICKKLSCGNDRDRVRTVAAHNAFDMVRRHLR
ncbi:MAG: competence/damage-inducible protein A [Clostridiales bacterium]|nr:competence/damage-inducible protein A [Clostridiales bacterium]